MPADWLVKGNDISVSDFPTTNGRRVDVKITATGASVTLRVSGGAAPGDILFELPSFVNNIARSSAGSVDQATGTVTLAASTTEVTVQFRRPPA